MLKRKNKHNSSELQKNAAPETRILAKMKVGETIEIDWSPQSVVASARKTLGFTVRTQKTVKGLTRVTRIA